VLLIVTDTVSKLKPGLSRSAEYLSLDINLLKMSTLAVVTLTCCDFSY